MSDPEFAVLKEGRHHSPASQPDLVEKTKEHLLALPGRRNDAGKYSLLRVVASFPAQTNLKRCLEEDPDQDDHPIASLNMNLVKHITKGMSPVGLLDGLEQPPQAPRKRKGAPEVAKPRSKKVKLNIN